MLHLLLVAELSRRDRSVSNKTYAAFDNYYNTNCAVGPLRNREQIPVLDWLF
jgi:hypothetical protein